MQDTHMDVESRPVNRAERSESKATSTFSSIRAE